MPLGVRTVVLGLLNGDQGRPMGGAPHVYLRRVGNGLVYCMATHFLRPAQLLIDTVSSNVSVTEFLPKNITLIVHFEFLYFDGLRKRLEEVK